MCNDVLQVIDLNNFHVVLMHLYSLQNFMQFVNVTLINYTFPTNVHIYTQCILKIFVNILFFNFAYFYFILITFIIFKYLITSIFIKIINYNFKMLCLLIFLYVYFYLYLFRKQYFY